MTTQQDLNMALTMYGQASVAYAAALSKGVDVESAFSNMAFWQEQVWHCAKDVAANKEGA